jgi:hypothetical protein
MAVRKATKSKHSYHLSLLSIGSDNEESIYEVWSPSKMNRYLDDNNNYKYINHNGIRISKTGKEYFHYKFQM